eukprot:6185224-Pleurochrysis_carterae.AAC.2
MAVWGFGVLAAFAVLAMREWRWKLEVLMLLLMAAGWRRAERRRRRALLSVGELFPLLLALALSVRGAGNDAVEIAISAEDLRSRRCTSIDLRRLQLPSHDKRGIRYWRLYDLQRLTKHKDIEKLGDHIEKHAHALWRPRKARRDNRSLGRSCSLAAPLARARARGEGGEGGELFSRPALLISSGAEYRSCRQFQHGLQTDCSAQS